MLYALLCYHSEEVVFSWTKEEDDAVLAKLAVVQERLTKAGKLGPVARLMPTTTATTLAGPRPARRHRWSVCRDQGAAPRLLHRRLPSLEEAIEIPRELGEHNPGGAYEIRPLRAFFPAGRGSPPAGRAARDRSRLDRCDAHRRATACGRRAAALFPRPRYGRGGGAERLPARALHVAENGPPRDPAAWLILVGRNFAVDARRRTARQVPLPEEDSISDTADTETALAERLDEVHYRDDILRLLFVCCHPALPATQQIALALRIVSGLAVKEIARAFLVSEAAMEQRITRAKRRIAEERVPYEVPGAVERAERLAAVAAAIYLMFNEGYAATGGEAHVRAPLCEEAIRLARLLLRLFPSEPEVMGLTALMLLQHARREARLDAEGNIVLLEDQDRDRWDRGAIAEGLTLVDKALRHHHPGPFKSRPRSRRSTRTLPRPRTPTGRRSSGSMRDSSRSSPPRRDAQPRGRGFQTRGARPRSP